MGGGEKQREREKRSIRRRKRMNERGYIKRAREQYVEKENSGM